MAKDNINPSHYKYYPIDMMISIFGVEQANSYCATT